MKNITFIDTEVSEKNKILDYGAVKITGEALHTTSASEFHRFIDGEEFLCGHNVIDHDMKYIYQTLGQVEYNDFLNRWNVIDTLYLSPLLFPHRPYHKLLKDDKLQTEEINNPLNDAKKAKNLFLDEIEAFQKLPYALKKIYSGLLSNTIEFGAFFRYIDYHINADMIQVDILDYFQDKICSNSNLIQFIQEAPLELAYCLSLIQVVDEYSITPRWVVIKYPKVDYILNNLRGTPCIQGCSYCNEKLDAKKGLKMFFGYNEYRSFDGVPLQEMAVNTALHNMSLLAVFPTGGGKSITFQVPALMAGKYTKGLTVVISPLQSLMKDQVDNLEKNNITSAVSINGLLDPIERAEALRRVEEGEVSLLYISPELLRSRTIERLLLGRKINRFVIDEAHCFSAWGQDFRVDYLYIAEFIRNLCKKKNLQEIIPVSCFTATAKQNVIEDIKNYFYHNLNLNLELFAASSARKNLSYKVIQKAENDKYNAIRDLLSYKKCPTIIYVSRTKRATDLAERLNQDGYVAKAYHGQMDKKEKRENQDAFIRGEVDIMVATSAFGMGVDKKNVGLVIHYDISDSLENYVQEAGRAGRDPSISAECFVLFNDEDLNKHFLMLNQTKITLEEIQQVWKAIKSATRTRSRMSNSALEIARHAGWDDNLNDIETRVKTAIAALEDAGYIKRGQNIPHIYADSIQARSAMEAIDKIKQSNAFEEKEEEQAIRIIKKLISSRSRKNDQKDVAESRVDYISDSLGISKEQVLKIIQKLRDIRLLTDSKDLTAYLEDGSGLKGMNILKCYQKLEKFLLKELSEEPIVVNLKELNEKLEEEGLKNITPDKVRTLMNYWAIKGIMKRENIKYSHNHVKLALLQDKQKILKNMEKRWDIAEFILQRLDEINIDNETTVEFSVLELKEDYDFDRQLLMKQASSQEIEEALFYLSRIGALKLEGGFLITYNTMSIERVERDNKIRYKLEDYKKLKQYYEQKTQMIHIVGEYARKMMEDYQAALQFVDDYFRLEYSSFLRKYFKGSRGDEIKRNLSPEKFSKLFGKLSPAQLRIINDKQSQYIVVAAGPGSGKTRILVHKLASLLLMEDVKHEQLLMITFSRAAATEFKKRLIELIGNAANFVEIKTFHSYCFDLLGRVGTIEKSDKVIKEAIERLNQGEVEPSRVAKTVLVIDEAQDMDEYETRLIQELIRINPEMRVIAVGDDDQNIYSFRGSDSKYMSGLLSIENSRLYELVENYRSKSNLVQLANVFVEKIKNRMKHNLIIPIQKDNGQIQIVQYRSNKFLVPAIQKLIMKGIYGSTGILTKTNEEALQVAALLKKNSIRTRLLKTNEGFKLEHLVEIRFFLEQLQLTKDTYILSDDIWSNAKEQLQKIYKTSKNLNLCLRLIKDFEVANPEVKYTSDFMTFLSESKEEDFYDRTQGIVTVATIHKSKGWEFDHVVMLLSDFYLNSDEAKRLLYVGITRAKKSLTIHYNNNYFSVQTNLRYRTVEAMHYLYDYSYYEDSNCIVKQLRHRDIFLSYFYKVRNLVCKMKSGDKLKVDEAGCLDLEGNRILYFSERFKKELKQFKRKGYQPIDAKVDYVLYWKEEKKEQEVPIVFAVLEFEK
ncbi:MAG TPA: RecQ family ATP-dependent DNA helicase [Clostridiales bacterium]|nr:RecQ family ATP-dependent DNA helicase [Clostridiales bacterium]